MIDDEHTWFWIALAVAAYVAVIFSGCAAPDQPPPIQYYRQAYGFPTSS